jgi:hypothetical protein
MNKAVANCLYKETFTEQEMRTLKEYERYMKFNKFYKCSLCGKYHLTSTVRIRRDLYGR